MNNKKILLTGASGYVGARIYNDLKNSGYNIVGTYNKNKLFDELVKVNLKDDTQTTKVVDKINPDIIIHSAADAHTSTCEKEPNNAEDLNVGATNKLVEISKQNNIRFIFISTFACFNKNPIKVYPKTKIKAENLVKKLDNYMILRFSLVTGLSPNTQGHNFYNDLLRAYKKKAIFEADSDWKFETSYLGHIVEVIKIVIDRPDIKNLMIPVIEHGETSRFKIALDLLCKKGLEVKEVKSGRVIPPIETDQTIYKKYGFHKHQYKDSIMSMVKELESLDS